MTALPLPVESPAIIEHLDEDWAVPCERVGRPNCGSANPAEWIAWMPRCCPGKPMYRLWCTPCVEKIRAHPDIRCPRCGALGNWPRLEPLNRRTK